MFLQAAGMKASTIHRFADDGNSHGLTYRQRRLVEFADKLTISPQAFTVADTRRLRGALANDEEVVEAANVVAGFNFANRVADALGVSCEVPEIVGRYRVSRRLAMRMMSWGIRTRMNFKNRELPSPDPDFTLAELRGTMRRARMGSLPTYFEHLRLRPHILAGHAAICQSLLRSSGFARATILRTGYLVSRLNADGESERNFANLLRGDGLGLNPADLIAEGFTSAPPLSIEHEVLLFVRGVSLAAHSITDDQVARLQRRGLSDIQILNLVLITAAYNSGNRLNRAFATSAAVAPSTGWR